MASWRERGGRLAVVTCLLTLGLGGTLQEGAWAEPSARPPILQASPAPPVDALGAPRLEKPVTPWNASNSEGPSHPTTPTVTPTPAANGSGLQPIYARVTRRVPVKGVVNPSPAPRQGRPPRHLSSRGSRGMNSRHHASFIRQETLVDISPLIAKYARQYNLDPHLVRAVIEVESQYRNHAVSRCGARGLMQLMPRTGHSMGARDLHDPEQNIAAGTRYMRAMLDRYSGRTISAIAAYNAGPGNVSLAGGVPNISETRRYVWKVFRAYKKFLEAPQPPLQAPPPVQAPSEAIQSPPLVPLPPSTSAPQEPAPSSGTPGAPGS